MFFSDYSIPWRLEWSEELSMFIPELDAEHQHLIHLVNQLNDAIIGRMKLEEIKHRMQAMVDFSAATHFPHEEALLRESGYPAAEEHAQTHARILLATRRIIGRFAGNETGYEWIDAALQIKKALLDCLLTEDLKFRDYCLASGRRPGGHEHPGGGSPGQPS